MSDTLKKQVGGNHYKDRKFQPIEIIREYGLTYEEGNVLKYLLRYRQKNGVEDLKKAKHYIDFCIESFEKETEEAPFLKTKELTFDEKYKKVPCTDTICCRGCEFEHLSLMSKQEPCVTCIYHDYRCKYESVNNK